MKFIFSLLILSLPLQCIECKADDASSNSQENSDEKAQLNISRNAQSKRVQEIERKYSYPAQKAYNAREYKLAAELHEKAILQWLKLKSSPLRKSKLHEELLGAIGAYSSNYNQELENLERCYLMVLENDPSKFLWYSQVANVRTRMGDLEGAENAYREYLKQQRVYDRFGKKSSVQSRGFNYTYLCAVLLQEKKKGEAEKVMKTAINEAENEFPGMLRAVRVCYRDFLKSEGRTEEADKLTAKLNDNHCPVCHSDKNVLVYVYGYPSRKLAPGTIGGGCIVTPYNPKFFCTRDKLSF